MHWRRKWQLTPVFLPGESRGWGSLVGFRLWGRTESDTTEATKQQQQHEDLLELIPKEDIHFIIGDLYAKVRSQEIPGVTGKFGLGVQNEAGQRLIEFCQENTLVTSNTLFQQHKVLNMDITRWSILKSDWLYSLQPKMEKLYSQQKQDWELTVAQVMSPLLQNSDLNWRSRENHWNIQGWSKSNLLWLYSRSDK